MIKSLVFPMVPYKNMESVFIWIEQIGSHLNDRGIGMKLSKRTNLHGKIVREHEFWIK